MIWHLFNTVEKINNPAAKPATIAFRIKSVAIGFNPINIVQEVGAKNIAAPALTRILDKDPKFRQGAAQIIAVILYRQPKDEIPESLVPELRAALDKYRQSSDPSDKDGIEDVEAFIKFSGARRQSGPQ